MGDEHILARPALVEKHYLNGFYHIFASLYSANYYSYLWGDVLAADTFEMFRENGFTAEGLGHSGSKYRDTLLAVGGSKPARDVFIELRGRLPSVQAFLKNYGLKKDE